MSPSNLVAVAAAAAVAVAWPAAVAAQSAKEMAAASVRIAVQQKTAADKAAEAVDAAIAGNRRGTGLDETLTALSEQTTGHCYAQISALERRLGDERKSRANISAWGKLITLLGAVTAYAPGKTVLTGIGIAGAGDNSVLGFFAEHSAEEVERMTGVLLARREAFQEAMARYRAIKPANDDTGHERRNALAAAKEGCDGLFAAVKPADPGASAPGPKASDNGT